MKESIKGLIVEEDALKESLVVVSIELVMELLPLSDNEEWREFSLHDWWQEPYDLNHLSLTEWEMEEVDI